MLQSGCKEGMEIIRVGLAEAVEACKWLGLGEEVTEVFQVRKGGVGCGSDWRNEGKGRRPGPRFSPEQ